MSRYIPAEKIREQLKTDDGRNAFDRLNALQPNWDALSNETQARLTPSISYIPPENQDTPGDSHVIHGGIAQTFDGAAIGKLAAIVKEAEKPGTRIVVNTTSGRREEFTYNPDAQEFTPCD